MVTGGGANTPEEAVEEFLRAAYEADINRAMSFLCSAQREPMRAVYADMNAAYVALGELQYDLSELIYEIVSEDDNSAVVAIIGDVVITVDDEERRINVDQRFAKVNLKKEDELWRVC